LVKMMARLRMAWADWRGHHGKVWDYEPGSTTWADTKDIANTRRGTASSEQDRVDSIRRLHITVPVWLRHITVTRSQTPI